jgi:two-component system response regulator AtoC
MSYETAAAVAFPGTSEPACADPERLAATPHSDETARAMRLDARVRSLVAERDPRTGSRRVVGDSAKWRDVLAQAVRVAPTPTTVLLLGESGTGKEVLARFLHRASSRDHGPFVAINCAALPEHLLEAELFGYERGAFTGAAQSKPGQLELAAGGTLFLDEIGEMSPSAQSKLLRVLQEREFQRIGGTRVLRADVRIIAATNRQLDRAMAAGQFREDLYYRLSVFPVRLPALRDRVDDVLPLSRAFLEVISRDLRRPMPTLSREAREALLAHPWPGNVRELRNTLERATILCDGAEITAAHLGLAPITVAPAATPTHAPSAAVEPLPTNLASMERAVIERALAQARFNKSRAAKAVGLTRHQLYVRMRRYSLA